MSPVKPLTFAQKMFFSDVSNYRGCFEFVHYSDRLPTVNFSFKAIEKKINMELDEGAEDDDSFWCKVPMTWTQSPNRCVLDVFWNFRTHEGLVQLIIEDFEGYDFKVLESVDIRCGAVDILGFSEKGEFYSDGKTELEVESSFNSQDWEKNKLFLIAAKKLIPLDAPTETV